MAQQAMYADSPQSITAYPRLLQAIDTKESDRLDLQRGGRRPGVLPLRQPEVLRDRRAGERRHDFRDIVHLDLGRGGRGRSHHRPRRRPARPPRPALRGGACVTSAGPGAGTLPGGYGRLDAEALQRLHQGGLDVLERVGVEVRDERALAASRHGGRPCRRARGRASPRGSSRRPSHRLPEASRCRAGPATVGPRRRRRAGERALRQRDRHAVLP